MESAEIIASALLQTTYDYFWPAFRRVVLFDLRAPKGSDRGFVVSSYTGPITRQRLGAPITLEWQGSPFEWLDINLADLKLAETQASPALAILKLAWTQLGPNSLHITLSTRPTGHLAANNVSLFRSLHDAITLLYPEAGEQQSWLDALLPDTPPFLGQDGCTLEDAFDWYHRGGDSYIGSIKALADYLVIAYGTVRNRHAAYMKKYKDGKLPDSISRFAGMALPPTANSDTK